MLYLVFLLPMEMQQIQVQQPVINGDGLNTRDYVFVSDVVKANLLALNNNVSGIFNVATGVEHDVNFIFEKLKYFTRSDCKEIHAEAKEGEQRRSVCSYDKIHKNFGWKPEIDFETGLGKTVEFFRNRNKS